MLGAIHQINRLMNQKSNLQPHDVKSNITNYKLELTDSWYFEQYIQLNKLMMFTTINPINKLKVTNLWCKEQ